jgi:hypothetical protein
MTRLIGGKVVMGCRLEENNPNGTTAVRCYGYVTVPAEEEEQLQRKFQVWDWDRRNRLFSTAFSKQ